MTPRQQSRPERRETDARGKPLAAASILSCPPGGLTNAVGSGAPVRVPKIAEIVAGELRWRIISGQLAEGDELPRESDVIDEFGVSRPSVREALRILETEGLIRIRRGKVGGAVVCHPTSVTAAYNLGLTLQANRVSLEDLAIARLSIEPVCAGLAAGLPDRDAVVEQLTRLVDESEDAESLAELTALTQRFHTRVIELCENFTLQVVTGALSAVWGHHEAVVAPAADAHATARTREGIRASVVAAHRAVIAAIDAGDTEAAPACMRDHLDSSQHDLIASLGSTEVRVAGPPAGSS